MGFIGIFVRFRTANVVKVTDALAVIDALR